MHPSIVLASAEPLLIAVVGVLSLVIVGLGAMAIVLGRRTRVADPPPEAPRPQPAPGAPASRPRRARTSDPSGVIARICPVCGTKYDLNARFCGHDAGELVVIN